MIIKRGNGYKGRTYFKVCCAITVLLKLLFASANAQPYSIAWRTIAGGGGISTGGAYALNGTIGQPDVATVLSGGNYSLTGGFWSLASVVQTTSAPTLQITQATNNVTVFWQNLSGWSLQQNEDLALPTGWITSSGVSTSNGTNSLTIRLPARNLFFRLIHP